MELTQKARLPLSLPLPVRGEVALVEAARHGDDRAFEQLYASYRDRIHAFIVSKVRDHGRAEDLGQEVFMSALRQLRASDQTVHFKPWLYTIAKNACIDEYRRGARAREVPIESGETPVPGTVCGERLLSALPTPAAAIESKQKLDDLRGAFDGLSDSHHRLLVMREFEGLSYDEIGTQLGMTKQMVESGLFRARRKLSAEYDELASGRRCEQIQSAIDGGLLASARRLGIKERRRYSRHLSHCQPCRHVATMTGVDEALLKPRSIADKVAALLPFGLLRRLWPFGGRGRGAAGAAGHHAAAGGAAAAGVGGGAAGAGIGSGQAAAVAVLALAGAGGGLALATHHSAHPRIAPARHALAAHGSSATSGAARSGLGASVGGARSGSGRSSGVWSRSGRSSGATGSSHAHSGAVIAHGRGGLGSARGVTTASASSGRPGHTTATTSRHTGSTSASSGGAAGGAATTGVRDAASTGASGVASAANGAKTTVAATTSGVSSTVKSTTSGVSSTVKSTTSAVGSTVNKATSAVGTTVTTAANGVGTTINTAVPGAGTPVTQVGTATGTAVNGVGSTVGTAVTSVGTTAGTAVNGVGSTVSGILGGLG